MKDTRLYLSSYVLQQDMRIRMPKAIIENLGVEKGTTFFDIYLDTSREEIVLKVHKGDDEK